MNYKPIRIFQVLLMLLLSVSSKAQMWSPITDGCADPTLTITGPTENLCPHSTYNYTPSLSLPPGFTVSDYTWSPLTGIVPISLATGTTPPVTIPITFSGTSTTYNLAVNCVGPNLINNGTFETGSTTYPGFTTEYQDLDIGGSSGNADGHMKLGSWYGSAAQCLPPMPGGYIESLDVFTHNPPSSFSSSNRMLNVRGATCFGNRYWVGIGGGIGYWVHDNCAESSPGYFWGQNVSLCHNKSYKFTYWVRLMSPCVNPGEMPKLTVALAGGSNPDYVNEQTTYPLIPTLLDGGTTGREVGNNNCGGWQQVSFTFYYGGPSGVFFICMYDNNQNGNGNDFSIDDISLNRIITTTANITLNPIPHTEDIAVDPNDASGGVDGYPCAGSNPFTIHCTPGATIAYSIDGGSPVSVAIPSGSYLVPFTATAGTTHTIALQHITIAGCLMDIIVNKSVTFIGQPQDAWLDGPQQVCQGDDFTITAHATYAEPGLYTTTYEWLSSPALAPPVTSAGGSIATFHASVPGPITITCIITNRCGSIAVSKTVTAVSAGAHATVLGCKPNCPGTTTTIEITGTPGATVYYTSTIPGFPLPNPFIMPAGPGLTTSFTLPPFTLPEGVYDVTIYEVDAGGCKNKDVIKTDVIVAYPTCNLTLIDATGTEHFGDGYMPCVNEPFSIRVTGNPGTYHVNTQLLTTGAYVTLTVIIPIGSTHGDIGPFVIPELTYGVMGFVMNDIVGCCTVTRSEGHELCGLNVISRSLPYIDALITPACIGTPTGLLAQTIMPDGWSSIDHINWEGVGIPIGTMSTPPATPLDIPFWFTTPTIPGAYTYSVTAVGTNGCKRTVTKPVVVGPAPSITGPDIICFEATGAFFTTISGGTWTSNLPAIVSVDPASGIATGASAGTATITYTSPVGCFDTKKVTVYKGPVIINEIKLCGIFGTVTLPPPVPGGTWSSSNTSVATIDATGLVIPAAIGTTNITYSLGGGCLATYVTILTIPPTPVPTACVENYGLPTGNVFRIYGNTIGAVVSFTQWVVCLGAPLSGSITSSFCTDMSESAYGSYYFDVLQSPMIGTPPTGCNQVGLNLSTITVYNPDGSVCYSSPLSCSMGTRPGNPNIDSNVQNSTSLSITPNPTSGTFTISGSMPGMAAAGEATVEVIDMVGKTLFTETAPVADGSISKKLSMGGNIANGVYFIKVKAGTQSQVIRFTLNR